MSTLNQIQIVLQSIGTKMRNSVKSTLHEEAVLLLSDFKEHSPEDTGKYKSLWFIGKSRFAGVNSVANVVIKNTDPKASVMEFGAAKHEAPWFYPGGKKRTGKLVVRNGRVWAGGLNPGHSKTVGGAINRVLYNNSKRQMRIVKKIASNMIEAIR